jgi:UDP-3-O-[3-hydroxymyristoyl] glucosamine N-acyltransferase
MIHTVSSIAALLGLSYQGDGTRRLSKVSGWEAADESCLVFLERERKPDQAAGVLRAACILAPADLVPEDQTAIISGNPKLDFARAAALISPNPCAAGIRHDTAIVSTDAEVAADADIGPRVIIGPHARISRGCILHAGVVIGAGCALGKQCILHPNVVLYPGAVLGDRVILHAGAVVGSDGFGYIFDGSSQIKFPQAGKIIIEDDVEIGANTTLDRGSLGVTRIGTGAKIDNLVQIAHNVQIGRGVVIAAQTGISGSTVIEEYAVIGGQVGMGDHVRVQSGAVIGSKAGVLPGKIVRGGEVYWGVPVRPLREFKRLNALFGRLPELKADIDALKETVARLEEILRDREE